jgi:hypothetical protein
MDALRRAILVAAAAAVAAIVVLVLVGGGSAPAPAPSAPVEVRAGFEGAAVQFGDPFVARVVVVLDRGAVQAHTLHVGYDLAPLTPLAAPMRRRSVSGRLETVTIAQRVACLTAPCLARTIALPRVHVSVTARAGRTATASAAWRPLRLGSRVSAADLARANPRLVAETAPGPVSYRVAPATAATVLEAVAALAAAGAAALLALEALAFVRRRRRAVAGDELARALRLVREAEERPVPDRRRALGLLSRLAGGASAHAARDLAWSEPAPEPEHLDELVARLEQERT